jgi:xylose isomerase
MWIFGRIIDRYATDGYGPPVGTIEAIRLAGSTELIGIDLNYPFDEGVTVREVADELRTQDLHAVCITPIIYGRQFRSGSFTNPDPALRAAAHDLAVEAVDVAAQLGARYVKFWPGQDGYDYPFQVNYKEVRTHGLTGIRDIARLFPEVSFGIEYKLKEPRTHLLWSTGAATLLALDQMKADNVGVVIDFGHSLFAKENPAEVLSLVHETGRLVDIELCDNYREWDDDLAAGSLHVVETLEFLHMVHAIGWNEPLKLDLFPYRENAQDAVAQSIMNLQAIEDRAARIDPVALGQAQSTHDAMNAQQLIRSALFG